MNQFLQFCLPSLLKTSIFFCSLTADCKTKQVFKAILQAKPTHLYNRLDTNLANKDGKPNVAPSFLTFD